MTGRCSDVDADGVLCQLIAGHSGLHAADAGDALVTWQFGEVLRWRKHPAPHWIIELPWLPGLHPLPDHDAA